MDKKNKVFIIISCILLFFLLCSITATGFYKHKYDKLISEHRQQLELVRSRTEQYENTYRLARETNSELGKCLSESVTTLSGLRHQISEVRKRYEKMEELLDSSIGCYDFDGRDFNSNHNTTEYEIEDDKCTTFTE